MRLLASHGVPIGGVFWLPRAFGDQTDTEEFLLEHGCDPDADDFVGFTPLYEAAKWSEPDVVKLLLDPGADMIVRTHRVDQSWNRWRRFPRWHVKLMLTGMQSMRRRICWFRSHKSGRTNID